MTLNLTKEARREIERVLARADAEPTFLALLRENPRGALADTALQPAERALVASLRRVDLEEHGVDVLTYRHFLVHDGCLRVAGSGPLA